MEYVFFINAICYGVNIFFAKFKTNYETKVNQSVLEILIHVYINVSIFIVNQVPEYVLKIFKREIVIISWCSLVLSENLAHC